MNYCKGNLSYCTTFSLKKSVMNETFFKILFYNSAERLVQTQLLWSVVEWLSYFWWSSPILVSPFSFSLHFNMYQPGFSFPSFKPSLCHFFSFLYPLPSFLPWHLCSSLLVIHCETLPASPPSLCLSLSAICQSFCNLVVFIVTVCLCITYLPLHSKSVFYLVR